MLFSGGLDSAVLLARAAQDWPRPAALRARSGSPGSGRSGAIAARLLAALACRDRHDSAAGVAALRHDATSIRRRTGPSAARHRRSTRPTRTSTSKAATSCCSRRRRSSWPARASRASGSGRSPAIPFPDATAAFFDAFARALSIGLATPIEIEAPFATLHKSDVIRLGGSSASPLGSDAVVHAAATRAALRPLQQVPRAPRRVHRGRSGGPDGLRGRTNQIVKR